jgi:hypothetical protein
VDSPFLHQFYDRRNAETSPSSAPLFGAVTCPAAQVARAALDGWLYYNLLVANGLIPALWNSARVTLRVLWRVARQVFHEATGALFALFAIYGVVAVWRQWKTRPVLWVMGFALVYAAMMAVWAFAAFRRSRRVR